MGNTINHKQSEITKRRNPYILNDNMDCNVDTKRREIEVNRCSWCEGNELYIKYHDEEWGVPVHDDKKHFEFLTLESAQAGLSWLTILKKRENYRRAFDKFDPKKVSRYNEKKIEKLLSNSGIIRNRRKIEASVNNAKRFIERNYNQEYHYQKLIKIYQFAIEKHR